MKLFKKIIKISSIILGVILIVGILSFSVILEPKIPIYSWQKLDTSKLTNINRTLTILDDNNNIIADNIYDNNKIFTSINKIPKVTKDAFVSIEDKRFFEHKGIDYLRILGAFKSNLFSKTFKEGASTISQQLIKNTHLNNKKTLNRKLQELRIAKALERQYSKSQILEMYLNILYFGNNMYGIGTASKILFNKDVEQLNLNESATLAGIINNPSKYNPYNNIKNTKERRNLVLKQMLNLKKISDIEYNNEIKKDIYITAKNDNFNLQYINSVLREASIKLNSTENDLFMHNYKIETNLNLVKQEHVFHSMRDICSNNDVIMHAIILENKTANVLCDYGNSSLNLSYTLRQPGSTIKPLLCYSPAIEKNKVFLCSHILDEKINFGGYTPSNYQNKYYGNTTLRDSLCYSMNIPAVKLLEINGIEYSKSYLKKCKINFDKDDNTLALALGGMKKGLRLSEIANMYQVFGNNGLFLPCSYIKNIRNSKNEIIYSNNNNQATKVIRPDTSYLITNILEDCAKYGTAKKLCGLNNVAAKTGTVGIGDINTDAYCVAYTPDYTIAIWYGSKNNQTFNKISGGGIPTLSAATIINKLNLNDTSFAIPKEIVKLKIDASEQEKNHRIMLASNDIPLKDCKTEIFSTNNLPTQYSYSTEYDMFKKEFTDIDFNYLNYKIG